jgi:hypothetical protein
MGSNEHMRYLHEGLAVNYEDMKLQRVAIQQPRNSRSSHSFFAAQIGVKNPHMTFVSQVIIEDDVLLLESTATVWWTRKQVKYNPGYVRIFSYFDIADVLLHPVFSMDGYPLRNGQSRSNPIHGTLNP